MSYPKIEKVREFLKNHVGKAIKMPTNKTNPRLSKGVYFRLQPKNKTYEMKISKRQFIKMRKEGLISKTSFKF